MLVEHLFYDIFFPQFVQKVASGGSLFPHSKQNSMFAVWASWIRLLSPYWKFRLLDTAKIYIFVYIYIYNKSYDEVLKSHNMKVKTDLT